MKPFYCRLIIDNYTSFLVKIIVFQNGMEGYEIFKTHLGGYEIFQTCLGGYEMSWNPPQPPEDKYKWPLPKGPS